MALKETIQQMRSLLEHLSKNIEKAGAGNKAAAQRVRTASVVFARLAKVYRKESVLSEKGKKISKKMPRKKS